MRKKEQKQVHIKQNQKVLVAMSGGVDSSVTAALLKENGYDVSGAFIKGWYPDWLVCSWRDERKDAMRVCAKLDIPFQTIDASEEYKRDVVDYMISEYKVGRTPNPDVMCNKHIKFGLLFDFAMKIGFDFVATGHYVRLRREIKSDKSEIVNLLVGVDSNKDQSYFLWTLTQNILCKTLFPIGEFRKSEIRDIAKQFDMHTATKKDSQGVCFLEDIEMKEFLKHYIDVQRGDILNESNEVVGKHDGAVLYTIGQRHGFSVTKKSPFDEPSYIVEKNVGENTITVSSKPTVLNKYIDESVIIGQVNWISDPPLVGRSYISRIRYRQPMQSCAVEMHNSNIKNKTWKVNFQESQQAVTPGQSLVLYEEEKCIGGGIIEQRGTIGDE